MNEIAYYVSKVSNFDGLRSGILFNLRSPALFDQGTLD